MPVGRVATPLRSGTNGPGTPLQNGPIISNSNSYIVDSEKRGKKRERDDVGGPPALNGIGTASINGAANANPSKAILNAKAGIAGARPRPIKKQRMVSARLSLNLFHCRFHCLVILIAAVFSLLTLFSHHLRIFKVKQET